MTAEDDLRHMKRVLAMARAQHGRTGSRPAVACTIISKIGHRLADGATSDEGVFHAEEIALSALAGRAPGATVYVSLEPCRERTHGGASCSEQLIKAGVVRVVCATRDPHPKGEGGISALEAAGVTVEVGVMQDDADALYADFFERVAREKA